jgi:hypothetical protein
VELVAQPTTEAAEQLLGLLDGSKFLVRDEELEVEQIAIGENEDFVSCRFTLGLFEVPKPLDCQTHRGCQRLLASH